MKIIIISEADYKTSTWSGGETTELFLFPPNGDYAKREFDFRLSTATVELEESDFTSLPGFERLIMSLDNSLELHHRNVDKLRVVELEPFEVDQFSGSDLTKSFGKCQDFNLIYANGYKGNMKTKYSGDVTQILSGVTCIYYALKSAELKIRTEELEQQIKINTGELLVLSELKTTTNIEINSDNKKSEPLVIEVNINRS
ncbi:HutD family protein [Vagococcus fluvialis]|uniref:HutD family protein n=1 Tax=Vagococcus fluvialis TaxID=2738 RepID=UPI003B58E615